jgi:MFS transporter, SP family, solute carrier family 2 (myo-inositol transporter), member 13
LIIFFYPEVSGLPFEEISEVFKHGFGVKYPTQLRKDPKDIVKARLATRER